MFRSFLAVLLCAAVSSTGCASAAPPRVAPASSRPPQDVAVLADYVQRIPAGSKVRVERANGKLLRGTLMQASAERVIVQENTRVPEPPVTIPVSDIARLAVDTDSSTRVARTIGIGVATGAAAALAVFAIIAAMLGD
jgi:hypothetical protein